MKKPKTSGLVISTFVMFSPMPGRGQNIHQLVAGNDRVQLQQLLEKDPVRISAPDPTGREE